MRQDTKMTQEHALPGINSCWRAADECCTDEGRRRREAHGDKE